MSANNWMVCPRCKKVAEEAQLEKATEVDKLYGKIPRDEYLRRATELSAPVKLKNTFREDYEQGMSEDGSYMVSYFGQCTECDYQFRYTHLVHTEV